TAFCASSRERTSPANRAASTPSAATCSASVSSRTISCPRAPASRPASGGPSTPPGPWPASTHSASSRAARRNLRFTSAAPGSAWASRPRTGGHQRRSANPTWVSNMLTPGGPAVSASVSDSSNVSRPRSRSRTPWQWWSTSGSDSRYSSTAPAPFPENDRPIFLRCCYGPYPRSATPIGASNVEHFPEPVVPGQDLDARARARLGARGSSESRRLAGLGIVAVALTWVDISGITRTKTVPVERLQDAAAWGVGMSPVFDAYLLDDTIVSGRHAGGPVGDLRLHPDLDRLVPLAALPGWAHAPAFRYAQDGT